MGYSIHQNDSRGNKYYANVNVTDTNQATYDSISVTASGCVALASTALIYENDGQWYLPTRSVLVSSNTPPSGCTQAFDVTAVKKAGGTDTVHREITGYVEEFATNLLPTGNVSVTPTFSWTGIDAAVNYSIELFDGNLTRIWT